MSSIEPVGDDQETLTDLPGDAQTAILSLAWALERGPNARFLLSGTVELMGSDTAPEFERALHPHELSDRYFAFFQRYELTPIEALEWYRSCAAGQVNLPESERPDAPLLCQDFLPEPPWPALQCPTMKIPGSSCNDDPARTCSLFPNLTGWEDQVFTTDERRRALDFLREQLEFDFAVDPEYLGAAHLVARDPDLLAVEFTRGGRTSGGRFAFHVAPTFRQGKAPGFKFVLYRHRPRGSETPITVPLDGKRTIELSHGPFSFSYDVIHDKRGLVCRLTSAIFLEGFDMEVGLITRARKSKYPQFASGHPRATASRWSAIRHGSHHRHLGSVPQLKFFQRTARAGNGASHRINGGSLEMLTPQRPLCASCWQKHGGTH